MTRAIFEFFDGEKKRKEDGTKLAMKMLSSVSGSLNQHFKNVQATMMPEQEGETPEQREQREQANNMILAMQAEAGLELAKYVKELLDLKDYHFDGEKESGLNVDEQLALMFEFLAWYEELKKNTVGLQLHQPSTGGKHVTRKRKN